MAEPNSRSPLNSLGELVRTYAGDLSAVQCRDLIGQFEQHPQLHKRNGKSRNPALAQSQWTELDLSHLGDPRLQATIRQKITFGLGRYNRDIQLSVPVPNSPRIAELIVKRYDPGLGDNFQLHFDSVHEVANRYLVILWYLNDVSEGGETEFPDLGLSVRPEAGKLLIFPPYWMYQHRAQPPRSNAKYILSSYLLF